MTRVTDQLIQDRRVHEQALKDLRNRHRLVIDFSDKDSRERFFQDLKKLGMLSAKYDLVTLLDAPEIKASVARALQPKMFVSPGMPGKDLQ